MQAERLILKDLQLNSSKFKYKEEESSTIENIYSETYKKGTRTT